MFADQLPHAALVESVGSSSCCLKLEEALSAFAGELRIGGAKACLDERDRDRTAQGRGTHDCKEFLGAVVVHEPRALHDYENRLPRGRTYLRDGSVLDLQIGRSEVSAMVARSERSRS